MVLSEWFEEITVQITCVMMEVIVAGGQDLFVGGHQVVVILLACAMAGDAIPLDDGLNVDIIRRALRLLPAAGRVRGSPAPQSGHPTNSA